MLYYYTSIWTKTCQSEQEKGYQHHHNINNLHQYIQTHHQTRISMPTRNLLWSLAYLNRGNDAETILSRVAIVSIFGPRLVWDNWIRVDHVVNVWDYFPWFKRWRILFMICGVMCYGWMRVFLSWISLVLVLLVLLLLVGLVGLAVMTMRWIGKGRLIWSLVVRLLLLLTSWRILPLRWHCFLLRVLEVLASILQLGSKSIFTVLFFMNGHFNFIILNSFCIHLSQSLSWFQNE